MGTTYLAHGGAILFPFAWLMNKRRDYAYFRSEGDAMMKDVLLLFFFPFVRFPFPVVIGVVVLCLATIGE